MQIRKKWTISQFFPKLLKAFAIGSGTGYIANYHFELGHIPKSEGVRYG